MDDSPTPKRMEVHLLERHVAFLERLSREIQQANQLTLEPPVILRALVEALDETGGVNPGYISGEEDLVEVFVRRLTGQGDPTHDRERMRPTR